VYLGDLAANQIFDFKFTTRTTTGAPTTLAGTPTLAVYKDNSTTEITAGITLTADFDARTGLNHVRIDLSASASYVAGEDYSVVITAGTVGGTSVVGEVVGNFSVENRGKDAFKRAVDAIVLGTVGPGATTTSIPTSSLVPAASVTDQYRGRIVAFDKNTTTTALRGQATDVTASTAGGTLTVTALSTAPASGDSFTIQ
jgi:hypothetical protein